MNSASLLQFSNSFSIEETPVEYGRSVSGKRDDALFFEALSPTTQYLGRTYLANDDNHDLVATGAAIKMLLSKFSMHLRPHIRAGLYNQSKRLISPAEWDDDDDLPSIDSFRTLLRSIVELDPGKHPNLGLGPSGMFLGMWFSESDRFTVEFWPQDRVHWVATTSGNGNPSRTSGDTTIQKMLDLIDGLGVREIVDGKV